MSEEITRRVLGTDEYRRACSLFLYLSTPEEADTRALITEALSQGKAVYLPRIRGEEMQLVAYQKDTPLKENEYGISEPQGEPSSVTPDLALIPLVGFDRDKHRLGRGKGYYDRFLANYSGKSMALAFSAQEWESIPVDALDRRPDVVTTDKEIIR